MLIYYKLKICPLCQQMFDITMSERPPNVKHYARLNIRQGATKTGKPF